MDELLNAVVELPLRERIGQGYRRGPVDDLKVTREPWRQERTGDKVGFIKS